MARPKILVTGASGKTGGAVVAQLLAKSWPVRAVVRVRDARSERLDRLGVETVVADMYDPESLREAMRGTSRAYYLPPFQPHMIHSAAAFATAAGEARLESIVLLSQWLASPFHPSPLTRQHWLAEKLFSTISGTALTIVNPGYFADNYLRLIPFAAHLGILPSLTGDSLNAPPSNEDIARVAAAALIDPDRHAGRRWRPTGPALLSTADMAPILSRVLGRTVRRVEMPFWMLVKAARIQGVAAFDLSSLRHYNEDHRQGAFAFGAPSADVFEATGRPAEDFETTARRYAEWPEARRSLGNRAKAIFDFLRTPISPGYDLDRLEREQGFPDPAPPRFAMQDERWKAERALQTAPRALVRAEPLRAGAAA